MKSSFRVYLKAGERLYVNGAVLRVDRKVAVEFMNDVAFLLESNVMQPEETTTPLRQLYFVAQTLLMGSDNAEAVRALYEAQTRSLGKVFKNEQVLGGIAHAQTLVDSGRVYDALRTIRGLLPVEDQILGRASPEKNGSAIKERMKA